MRNISTKLGVLIVGFLVFLSPLQATRVHAGAPQAPVDVLVDGDMEAQNMDAWRVWGRVTPQFTFEKNLVHPEAPVGQRYAMHMNAQATNGGIQQLNIPVQAGKTYLLKMSYRLVSGSLRPLMGIRNSNTDFENKFEVLSQVTPNDPNVSWGYARYVTIPNNFVGDFRFVLTLQNGEAYIEEVTLLDVDTLNQGVYNPNADDSRLVRDPYMSMGGISHWKRWGNPVLLEKDFDQTPRDEWDTALHIDARGTSSGVQQFNIPVRAGQSYRLQFSHRVLSGALQPMIGIGTSNSDFERQYVALRPNNAWQNYQRDFTVPLNFSGDFRLVFVLKNGEGWLDDVTLTPLQNAQVSGTLSIQDRDRGDWVGLPNREVVVLGTQNINLGDFTFSASAEEDISVSAVRFVIKDYNNPQGQSPQLINYALKNGAEVLGNAVGIFEPGLGEKVFFENIHVVIPRNQNIQLTLFADSLSLQDGGISSEGEGYLVSLDPVVDNQASVDAVGTSSATILSGVHVLYGPLYGAFDHDFGQMGKYFDLRATDIALLIMPQPNQIVAAVNQQIARMRTVNTENASQSDAEVSTIDFSMYLDGYAPTDTTVISVYNEVDHSLLGQIEWNQGAVLNAPGITAARRFSLPLQNTIVLAPGEGKNMIVTMDLQDAANKAAQNTVIRFVAEKLSWTDRLLAVINSYFSLSSTVILQ